MTPLDIISLQQAKDHLVVDYPDRDAEIERHIKTAIGFIEKYTNVMMYEREKVYTIGVISIEIYDYPIVVNTSTLPIGTRSRNNVMSVTYFGYPGMNITATVGYANVSDIPSELIEAAYKMITYLFENRDMYSIGLPVDIQFMINGYRRSATF